MGLDYNIAVIIGKFIYFVMFLSPMPTFYRICKNKTVEEFQSYPYICMSMSCLVWMLYHLSISNYSMFIIYCSAHFFSMLYQRPYTIYVTDHKKKEIFYASTILCQLLSMVVFFVVLLLCSHSRRNLFIGIVPNVFDIIMYVSPLAIWKRVVTTGSVEYMPFWISLAVLSNGIYWTIYEFFQFDILILVSSGLGAISGAIQLCLYGYFHFNGN